MTERLAICWANKSTEDLDKVLAAGTGGTSEAKQVQIYFENNDMIYLSRMESIDGT